MVAQLVLQPTNAMTIASDGIVTFVDDIKIKNDGTIGSVGAGLCL